MKLETWNSHKPHFLRYVFDPQLECILILLKHFYYLHQQIKLLRPSPHSFRPSLQVFQQLIHLPCDDILVLKVALRPVAHVIQQPPLMIHVKCVVLPRELVRAVPPSLFSLSRTVVFVLHVLVVDIDKVFLRLIV